jgi:hypothetical protein
MIVVRVSEEPGVNVSVGCFREQGFELLSVAENSAVDNYRLSFARDDGAEHLHVCRIAEKI